jgi:hypothetical protein
MKEIIENFLRWLANLDLGWQLLMTATLYILIFGSKIVELIKKRSLKKHFEQNF